MLKVTVIDQKCQNHECSNRINEGMFTLVKVAPGFVLTLCYPCSTVLSRALQGLQV